MCFSSLCDYIDSRGNEFQLKKDSEKNQMKRFALKQRKKANPTFQNFRFISIRIVFLKLYRTLGESSVWAFFAACTALVDVCVSLCVMIG